MGGPFRRLPGLYGLHAGVSFRRGLRETNRSHPGANRTPLLEVSPGEEVSPASVQHLHAPGPAARATFAVAPVSEGRARGAGAAYGHSETASRTAAGHGGAAPAGARAGNASRVDPGTGRPAAPRGVAARLRAAGAFPTG